MKKIFLVFAVSLSALHLWGSEWDLSIYDKAAYEMNFSRHLWFASSNPAGMALTPLDSYSTVSLGYWRTEGDFRSLQRGSSEDLVSFNTNGAVNTGGTYLWGDFTFSRDYWKNSQYNTNLFFIDPDMPYYVADDNIGDWNKQSYDMSVKAAFPMLWERVVFGAEAGYLTYKGAKQIDPRGVPIGYAIEVSPAVAVLLGKGHSLGAVFTYKNSYERSTFSNVQGNASESVFLMKGLGFYSSGSVSGTSGLGTYYYPGNKFGGSLQYAFNSETFSFLADLGYIDQKIEVFQNPQTKYRMGTADKTGYTADMWLMWGKNVRHKISVEAEYFSTQGIEYLQERNTGTDYNEPYSVLAELYMSTYKTTCAVLRYDIYTGKDERSYSWNTGITASFEGKDDEYVSPYSVYNYNNISAGLFLKKNIRAGNTCSFLLGADGSYRMNLGGEYDYNGPDADHRVITVFYANEHHVSITDCFKVGAEASVSVMLRDAAGINIGLAYDALIPTADNTIRWCASAVLSLMF